MKNKQLYKLVLAALFAALIFLGTYLFHIPTGITGGYIHVGDTFIYLAAALLPFPYAAAAASIGAAMSDALSGSVIYVIPTLIIKALLTVFFTAKSEKIVTRRNVIAVFAAGATGLAGYFIAEAIVFGTFITPLLELPIGSIQPIASGILFVLLGTLLDKAHIKARLK